MTHAGATGSVWRKWDLHLHAPSTKLNDQFRNSPDGPWDKYCTSLHSSDVQAFGITDYFSADAYFATVDNYRQRYPQCPKFFLPNIELRISEVVNRASEEVHVHLIFNPHIEHLEITVNTFLGILETNKTTHDGKHVTASELKHRSDFEAATTNRSFILDAIRRTFGTTGDLSDHLLIITAANNDGIRPPRGRKRKELISDEIDKFSHAVFGSKRNVDYFLDIDRAEDPDIIMTPKPVFSGSDAHSFEELPVASEPPASTTDTPPDPTWIKADLTYEGLRQTIYEPLNRVFIGSLPPIERRVNRHKTRYIKELRISAVPEYSGINGRWFEDVTIPLNKELVAIIGNKGSGKSAITDIIGLLGNSHKQFVVNARGDTTELFSFLNRRKFAKRGYAEHFIGTLIWHDGEPDERRLDASANQNKPEKVEYLPQAYLERLCANIEDDEFRAILNRVIFGYVPIHRRFGQLHLEGLTKFLTQQQDAEIESCKKELTEINRHIVQLEKKLTIAHKDNIEERLRLKKQELRSHESSKPSRVDPPPSDDSDKVSEGTSELDKLIRDIQQCNSDIDTSEKERVRLGRVVRDLQAAESAFRRWQADLDQLRTDYEDVFGSCGTSFDDIVSVHVDYTTIKRLLLDSQRQLRDVDRQLKTEEQIRQQFDGDSDAASVITAALDGSFVYRKRLLEETRLKLVAQQAEPIRRYQAYCQELEEWKDRNIEIAGTATNPKESTVAGLKAELSKIRDDYPAELIATKKTRRDVSADIFDKKKAVKEFYDQIKKSIDVEIAECQDELGDSSITIDAALRFNPSFYETFLGFINQAKRGSYYGVTEGRSLLRNYCENVSDWQSEEEVFSALDKIIDALHFDKRTNPQYPADQSREIFAQVAGDNRVVDLYDYVYGLEFLETKYDLKVDNKDLSELSPGERGGLLLIFYLALDRRHIPLIIDQPEDNLDNKSVYQVLVAFIRRAKAHRQIIMVTHNPNLAVVADAEQLIHVSIDKMDGKNEFSYCSGAIENRKINEAVVDILEGTRPAFDNRRLKYGNRRAR